MTERGKFAVLEKSLSYHFKNSDLLERALTHASVTGEQRSGSKKTLTHESGGKAHVDVATSDNEAMEFLGDRVLGLVVAELLLERFPEANEGALARVFNKLVRRETCAAVGRKIGLGRFLLLSSSEAESGGREKTTIIADAMEAILAAVFADSSYDVTRKVVRGLWEPYLDSSPPDVVDAKTTLQEWAQAKGFSLPRYREVERTGPDHAPRFTVEVIVQGLAPERGEGMSKRTAEQAAASSILVREGVSTAVSHE